MQTKHDNKITDGQRRYIFALAKQAGHDNDALHEVVKEATGKTSLKDLTREDVEEVLLAYGVKGAGGRGKARHSSLVTRHSKKWFPPGKGGLIQELEHYARIRWGDEHYNESLNRLVNSHRKHPTHYKFLDIAGLKAMVKRVREMGAVNANAEHPTSNVQH